MNILSIIHAEHRFSSRVHHGVLVHCISAPWCCPIGLGDVACNKLVTGVEASSSPHEVANAHQIAARLKLAGTVNHGQCDCLILCIWSAGHGNARWSSWMAVTCIYMNEGLTLLMMMMYIWRIDDVSRWQGYFLDHDASLRLVGGQEIELKNQATLFAYLETVV